MEIFWIVLILQAFICGILSSNLAKHKGQSIGAWFAVGFFLGIFGLIAAAGLPTKIAPPLTTGLLKKCPDCAESIHTEALVCKFCGRKFGKEQVVADLIKNLSDESLTVKLQALDALRATKDSSVVTHLVKLIEFITPIANQFDPNVQLLNKTIQILSELRDPSSIPVLITCLKMHWIEEIRDVVTESLQRFGEAALPHLDQLMKDGERADRKLAEQIIARIKSTPTK